MIIIPNGLSVDCFGNAGVKTAYGFFYPEMSAGKVKGIASFDGNVRKDAILMNDEWVFGCDNFPEFESKTDALSFLLANKNDLR